MEALWLLVVAAVLAVPVVVLVLWGRANELARRVGALEAELKALARRIPVQRLPDEFELPAPQRPPVAPAPLPSTPPWAGAPSADPVASASPPLFGLTPDEARAWGAAPAAPARPAAASSAPDRSSIVQARAASPAPPVASAPSRTASAPLDASGLEQLIGGVWLQNLGAVVLLVGVFLMILWGYTTHRFGPQVLVAAGVVLGAAFVWRGDRVARRVAPFGHALIGVGLGIVYLTLHLGYVRLHVIPPALALVALVLVSLLSILAGLRYRVQLIAVLGVIGAFLPQFLSQWLDLSGFQMPPTALLLYLGAIDALVFVLAARAGWSALSLLALVLSAMAWMAANPRSDWHWGEQIALAAIFTLLGVAPLPRLVKTAGRVRGMDLAVIAVAPLALLLASAPFLVRASSESVAVLLFALAAVTLAAAMWVDVRRPEQDLWAPLTGAATLFLTAALERALGFRHTPMAWCLEGALLVALGARERGGWLRLWGTLVTVLGAGAQLVVFADSNWRPTQLPVLHAEGVSGLVSVLAVFAVAALLARRRIHLSELERWLPELWALAGHALLAIWFAVEASHFATAIAMPEGRWWHGAPVVGIDPHLRRRAVQWAVTGLAWVVQAFALTALGTRSSRALPRLTGLLLGLFGALAACVGVFNDMWWSDQHPVLHLTAMSALAAIAAMAAASTLLSARRESLSSLETRLPEIWSLMASVMLVLWSAHEATHVAWATAQPNVLPGALRVAGESARMRTLSSVLTNAAWLVQAVFLLVAGWWRGSAFLRWCGLALLACTLLRFVVVDLQTVDVFWRFLTAIVVGAAMLGLSYVYQRRTRSRAGAGPERMPPE